jgi:hypothetical protein
MVFYRGGKFTVPSGLEWQITPFSDETVATDEALAKAGFHLRIQELYEPNGTGVKVWATPEGKHLVFLMTGKEEVESVFIPKRIDWLPFYVGYVVPFIQAQAIVQLNSRIERIVSTGQSGPTLRKLGEELF